MNDLAVTQRRHDNESPPDNSADAVAFDAWLADVIEHDPSRYIEMLHAAMDRTTELRGSCRRIFGQVGVQKFDAVIAVNLTESLHESIFDREWPAARDELERAADRMTDA